LAVTLRYLIGSPLIDEKLKSNILQQISRSISSPQILLVARPLISLIRNNHTHRQKQDFQQNRQCRTI